MKRHLIIGGMLALLLSSPALAQGPPPPPYGFWRNMELVQRLGLSPDQIGALKEGDKEFAKEARALHQRLDQAHRAMEEVFAQRPVDGEEVERATAELARLQEGMLRLHVRGRLGLHSLLTPEQLDELHGAQPPPDRRGPPPRPGE